MANSNSNQSLEAQNVREKFNLLNYLNVDDRFQLKTDVVQTVERGVYQDTKENKEIIARLSPIDGTDQKEWLVKYEGEENPISVEDFHIRAIQNIELNEVKDDHYEKAYVELNKSTDSQEEGKVFEKKVDKLSPATVNPAVDFPAFIDSLDRFEAYEALNNLSGSEKTYFDKEDKQSAVLKFKNNQWSFNKPKSKPLYFTDFHVAYIQQKDIKGSNAAELDKFKYRALQSAYMHFKEGKDQYQITNQQRSLLVKESKSKPKNNNFKFIRENINLPVYIEQLDRFKPNSQENQSAASKVFVDTENDNANILVEYTNNQWKFSDAEKKNGSFLDFHIKYEQNLGNKAEESYHRSQAVKVGLSFIKEHPTHSVSSKEKQEIIDEIGFEKATKPFVKNDNSADWDKVFQIDLEQYLLNEMGSDFKFVQSESNATYRVYEQIDGPDKVNISQKPGGDVWTTSAGIGGGFIDLHMVFQQGYKGSTKNGAAPKKLKHEALKAGLKYLNELPADKQVQINTLKKERKEEEANKKIKLWDLPDTKNNSYVISRGISQETLDLPLLKGTYGSKDADFWLKDGIEHGSDLIIPYFGKDHNGNFGIVGLEQKNYIRPEALPTINEAAKEYAIKKHNNAEKATTYEEKVTKMLPGSNIARGLWQSSNKENIERVLIFEQTLDALSFIEMHKEDKSYTENTLYIATGGAIRGNQYELIDEIMAEYKPKEFGFATDRDYSGRFYNLQILGNTSLGDDNYKFHVDKVERGNGERKLKYYNVNYATKDLDKMDSVISNFKNDLGLNGGVVVKLQNISKIHDVKNGEELAEPLIVASFTFPYRESNYKALETYFKNRVAGSGIEFKDYAPQKSTDWNDELNNVVEEPLQQNIPYKEVLENDLQPSENVFKISDNFRIARPVEEEREGEVKYANHTIGYLNYSDGSVTIKDAYKGFEDSFKEDLAKIKLFTRVVPGQGLVNALMTKGIRVEDQLNKDGSFDKVLHYKTKTQSVELGKFDFDNGKIIPNDGALGQFPENHEIFDALQDAEERLNAGISISPIEIITRQKFPYVHYKGLDIHDEKDIKGNFQKNIYVGKGNSKTFIGHYNEETKQVDVVESVMDRLKDEQWDKIEEITKHIKEDTLQTQGTEKETGQQKDKDTTVGETIVKYNGIEIGKLDTDTLDLNLRPNETLGFSESQLNRLNKDVDSLEQFINRHEDTRTKLNDHTGRDFTYNRQFAKFGNTIVGKWDKAGHFVQDEENVNKLLSSQRHEIPEYFDSKMNEILRKGKGIYEEYKLFEVDLKVSEQNTVYYQKKPNVYIPYGTYDNGVLVPNVDGANDADFIKRLQDRGVIYDKQKASELNIVANNYKNELIDKTPVLEVLSKYDFEEGNYANTIKINLSETPTVGLFNQALNDKFTQLDHKDEFNNRVGKGYEITAFKSAALEAYIERVGKQDSYNIDDLLHSPEVKYFMEYSDKEAWGNQYKFNKRSLSVDADDVTMGGQRVGYFREDKKEFIDILKNKDAFWRDSEMFAIAKELGAERVIDLLPRQAAYYNRAAQMGRDPQAKETVYVRSLVAENSKFIKNREALIQDKFRGARSEGTPVNADLFYNEELMGGFDQSKVDQILNDVNIEEKNKVFHITYNTFNKDGFPAKGIYDPQESTLIMNSITATGEELNILEAIKVNLASIDEKQGLTVNNLSEIYNLNEREFNNVVADIDIYDKAVESGRIDIEQPLEVGARALEVEEAKAEKEAELSEGVIAEEESEVNAEQEASKQQSIEATQEDNDFEDDYADNTVSNEGEEKGTSFTDTIKEMAGVVGNSAPFNESIVTAAHLGKSKMMKNFLIVGDAGVGKESIAQILTQSSDERREKPFTTVNASTLGQGTFESEMFGHEKGAFTGAMAKKVGLVESVEGGTIFIDEIHLLTDKQQQQLLTFLQEGTYSPVGSNDVKQSDVRVIAATNQDLKQLVADGTFREDLYYRLGQTINVPSLSERREDIPLIVEELNNTFSENNNREPLVFNDEVMSILNNLNYENNVRELKNYIQALEGTELQSREVTQDMLIQHVSTANYQYFDDEVIERASKGFVPTDDLKKNLDVVKEKFGIIGQSDALYSSLNDARRAARTEMNIYIHGETGTGKANLGKIIHELSDRKNKPLVIYDIGKVDTDNRGLADAELFGQVEGAYTGADKDRKGKFELADGGSLILDEIGNLSLDAQGKLLRALEYGEIRRIGSNEVIKVDVRVIVSTNEDLEDLVRQGKFRKDLLGRINQMRVDSPSLEERGEDKLLILESNLEKAAKGEGIEKPTLTEEAKQAIMATKFRGNVRSIESLALSAAVLHPGKDIPLSFLREEFDKERERTATQSQESTNDRTQEGGNIPSAPANTVEGQITEANFVRETILSGKLANNGDIDINKIPYAVEEGELIGADKVNQLKIQEDFVDKFSVDKDGFMHSPEGAFGRISLAEPTVILFEDRNGEPIRDIETDSFARLVVEATGYDVAFVEDEQELIAMLAKGNVAYSEIAKARQKAIESARILEQEEEFDQGKYLIFNIEEKRVGMSIESPGLVQKRDIESTLANVLAADSEDLMPEDYMNVSFKIEEVKGLSKGLKGKSNNALYNFLDRANDKVQPTFNYDLDRGTDAKISDGLSNDKKEEDKSNDLNLGQLSLNPQKVEDFNKIFEEKGTILSIGGIYGDDLAAVGLQSDKGNNNAVILATYNLRSGAIRTLGSPLDNEVLVNKLKAEFPGQSEFISAGQIAGTGTNATKESQYIDLADNIDLSREDFMQKESQWGDLLRGIEEEESADIEEDKVNDFRKIIHDNLNFIEQGPEFSLSYTHTQDNNPNLSEKDMEAISEEQRTISLGRFNSETNTLKLPFNSTQEEAIALAVSDRLNVPLSEIETVKPEFRDARLKNAAVHAFFNEPYENIESKLRARADFVQDKSTEELIEASKLAKESDSKREASQEVEESKEKERFITYPKRDEEGNVFENGAVNVGLIGNQDNDLAIYNPVTRELEFLTNDKELQAEIEAFAISQYGEIRSYAAPKRVDQEANQEIELPDNIRELQAKLDFDNAELDNRGGYDIDREGNVNLVLQGSAIAQFHPKKELIIDETFNHPSIEERIKEVSGLMVDRLDSDYDKGARFGDVSEVGFDLNKNTKPPFGISEYKEARRYLNETIERGISEENIERLTIPKFKDIDHSEYSEKAKNFNVEEKEGIIIMSLKGSESPIASYDKENQQLTLNSDNTAEQYLANERIELTGLPVGKIVEGRLPSDDDFHISDTISKDSLKEGGFEPIGKDENGDPLYLDDLSEEEQEAYYEEQEVNEQFQKELAEKRQAKVEAQKEEPLYSSDQKEEEEATTLAVEDIIPFEEKDIDQDLYDEKMQGFEILGEDTKDFVITNPLDDMDSATIAVFNEEDGSLQISSDNTEDLYIIKEQVYVRGLEVESINFDEGLNIEGIDSLKEYKAYKSSYEEEKDSLNEMIGQEEVTDQDKVRQVAGVEEEEEEAVMERETASKEVDNDVEKKEEVTADKEVGADTTQENTPDNINNTTTDDAPEAASSNDQEEGIEQEEGEILSEGKDYYSYLDEFREKELKGEMPTYSLEPTSSDNGLVFYTSEARDEVAFAYDEETAALLFNQDVKGIEFLKEELFNEIEREGNEKEPKAFDIAPDEIIEYNAEKKEEVFLGLSIGNDVLNNEAKSGEKAEYEYTESKDIDESIEKYSEDKIDQKYIYDNGFINNTLIKQQDILYDSKANGAVSLVEDENGKDRLDIIYTDKTRQPFQQIVSESEGRGEGSLPKDKMFAFHSKDQKAKEVYVVRTPKDALELYENHKSRWHFRGDVAIVSFNQMGSLSDKQQENLSSFLKDHVKKDADIYMNNPGKTFNLQTIKIANEEGMDQEKVHVHATNINKTLRAKNVNLADKAIANNQRQFIEGTAMDKKGLMYSQFKNVMYDPYADKMRFAIVNDEGGVGSYSIGKTQRDNNINMTLRSDQDITRGLYISNNPGTYDPETGKGIKKVVIADSPEDAFAKHLISPDENKSTLYVSTVKNSIKDASEYQNKLINMIGGNYKDAEIVLATEGKKEDYDKKFAFKFTVENPNKQSFYKDLDYRTFEAEKELNALMDSYSKLGIEHIRQKEFAKDREKNKTVTQENQFTLKDIKEKKETKVKRAK